MKKVKKHLIFKKRVNANGNEFLSIKTMSMEDIREYFSAAENAKTFKSAMDKVNSAYAYRYQNCNRSYEYVEDLGEVKFDDNLDITKHSKGELIQAINECGIDGLVGFVEGRL